MTESDPAAIQSAELDYETARSLSASTDSLIRQAVAANQSVSPEILYYLAEDSDLAVRLAVAANPSCPAKGNLLLAEDPDRKVRTTLAAKVANQRPPRRGSVAKQVLEHLAKDQVVEVRAIISAALKDVANADPVIISRLARDVEFIVAGPILEFSPVLADQDLLDIIASDPVPGALAAIARRSYVAPAVTNALVASNDTVAITHMLRNGNAQLQESMLDSLIEKSVHNPAWQEPLVYRPELTERSALRLAELVAVHLLEKILARKDLSPEAVRKVAHVVGERLRQQAAVEGDQASDQKLEQRYAARLEAARARHEKGQLDELTMMVMLLVDQPEDIIIALAARSGLPVTTAMNIIESQTPRAICALAWAAGMSATFAKELQVRTVALPLDKVLQPSETGGFAVKESDLRWQLQLFGVATSGAPAKKTEPQSG